MKASKVNQTQKEKTTKAEKSFDLDVLVLWFSGIAIVVFLVHSLVS